MIITPTEIREKLNKIWRDLQEIWCFDRDYPFPTESDVTSFLSENWVDINEIKAENPDCDDFALQQHAKVKWHHGWPFGEAFTNKTRGWSRLHSLNICVAQGGVLLVDAKKREIWQGDKNDNILWVRM